MFGIVRYSFTIVAAFCVAALSGDLAFGQVLKGEAAYTAGTTTGRDCVVCSRLRICRRLKSLLMVSHKLYRYPPVHDRKCRTVSPWNG